MKTLFKVEKGIKFHTETGELTKFLLSLNPGESFLFPSERKNSISGTATRLKKFGKLKYAIRAEGKDYRLFILE